MSNSTNTATATTATIHTVTYGNTIAQLGASTFAPAFHYNTKDPHSVYVDGVDVTEVFHEYTDVLKKESLAREAAKPKPKPADPVRSVTINPAAGTTTVVFKDGSVSMVHCNDEEFDPEKGIAMCFMKKMFDCRGCFNDFLNKYLEDRNWIKSSKRPRVKENHSNSAVVDEDFWRSPEGILTNFEDLTDEDWKEVFEGGDSNEVE